MNNILYGEKNIFCCDINDKCALKSAGRLLWMLLHLYAVRDNQLICGVQLSGDIREFSETWDKS